jgi:hypothetical protein
MKNISVADLEVSMLDRYWLECPHACISHGCPLAQGRFPLITEASDGFLR